MHSCQFCKIDKSNEKWQPHMSSSDLASPVVEMISFSGVAVAVVVLSVQLGSHEASTRAVSFMWLFVFVTLFLAVEHSSLVF